MSLKEVAVKINGKKLPLGILFAGIVAVSTLQAQMVDVKEDVADLKPLASITSSRSLSISAMILVILLFFFIL